MLCNVNVNISIIWTVGVIVDVLEWFLIWIIFVLCLGSKPDHSKTGGKKGLKVIQDPQYRRYSNKVDMDSALETFVPVRSELIPPILFFRLFFSSKHFTVVVLNCL